jgi:drug/metabolite transporter (DMT)-like permease
MSEERPAAVYFALALGVICFAASALLVRAADDAPGLTIAVWRTSLAALFLAPIALPRIGRDVATLSKNDVLLIGASGILLSFHFITWIESLYHTTIASASVLVTTSPIFLAILGFVLLKERLSRPVLVSIPIAVTGAVVLGLGDLGADAVAPRAVLGNSLALFAAVLVSGYLIIGRVIRRRTSWLGYVFPLYVVVAVNTLLVAIFRGTPLFGFSAEIYILCALMALGPQIIGHGSFNFAVKYIPAAVLGVLALLEPVLASIFGYIIFGEQPGTLAIFGMTIVLAGVAFTLLAGSTRVQRKDVSGGDQPIVPPLPSSNRDASRSENRVLPRRK